MIPIANKEELRGQQVEVPVNLGQDLPCSNNEFPKTMAPTVVKLVSRLGTGGTQSRSRINTLQQVLDPKVLKSLREMRKEVGVTGT